GVTIMPCRSNGRNVLATTLIFKLLIRGQKQSTRPQKRLLWAPAIQIKTVMMRDWPVVFLAFILHTGSHYLVATVCLSSDQRRVFWDTHWAVGSSQLCLS